MNIPKRKQPTKTRECCLGNKRGKVLEKEVKNDLRSKRTRRLLQQALTELMTQKGFSEISVQDITAKAEINRATFYAHFDDKYELLNASIRETFQALLSEKLPQESAFTLGNLHMLALTAHQYLADFSGQCITAAFRTDEALMVQQVHHEIRDILLDWLHRVPAAYSTTTSIEITATVVSWAIFGTIIEVAFNSRKITSEQLITQVLALLEPGLRAYLVAEAAVMN
jgi:AcrR family transcriptional regulator